MAWIQGQTTVGQLVQTLADAMVAAGWTLEASPGPDERVLKTTTDPEGAIRRPQGLQATLTGQAATGGGFTGGNTYYYAVTAEGPKGESVASTEVSVAQPTTPERVRLSWRQVDGALRYHIYRRTGAGTLERIGTTDGQCETFIDDGYAPQAGVAPPAGQSLTMYLRLRRLATTYHEITVAAGDGYNSGTNALINASPDVPLSFWNNAGITLDANKYVLYFGSITKNRIALVLYGDPTIDFNAYRVGFLYAGRLVPFPEAGQDVQGNFALMGSALSTYNQNPTTYGPNTGNGVDNVLIYRTKTGVLWQRHYLAFVTQPLSIQLEDKGFNPSQWTEKYHLSPIYVVHGYDGYRGWLEDALGVVAHNVVHLDEFLLSYPDGAQDRFKYFHLSPVDKSPMRNASPNNSYSVAILKA